MTATVTATHTSQAMAEWTKIFPRQVTENYSSSVTFMKQLTVVAISTITYLKNAFPEDSYMLETFGGLKLRILKKKCRDELAQFVSSALTQAFEAFDKKYLHQLALCFYEDECKLENLIEYHIFEYTYNSDSVTMSVHSKNRDNVKQTKKFTFDNVKERIVQMIRACVVIMESCQQSLPSSYDVSLRLYYNEDAPEGYQAPGYLCASESEDHLQPTLGDTINLGWVETPFHKLVAKCYIKDNFGASHEAIPSQNVPVVTQSQEDFTSPTESDRSVGEGRPLRCPCNKYNGGTAYNNSALLTCQYCNTQQHLACFGLYSEHAAAAHHCCTSCSDADPTRLPTDPRLAALDVRKRECLCIFRRTLDWCSQASSVSARQLVDSFHISQVNASKVMKLLHSHGIVKQDPESDLITPLKIIPEALSLVISKFFQSSEQTMVDRLVAETLASQNSQPDPVADVLRPMEMVSLQNASNLGRVIETPVLQSIENTALQQYREALLDEQPLDEELPLSGSHNPVKGIDKLGKKTAKRKLSTEDRPKLRSGVRTKRAKALP